MIKRRTRMRSIADVYQRIIDIFRRVFHILVRQNCKTLAASSNSEALVPPEEWQFLLSQEKDLEWRSYSIIPEKREEYPAYLRNKIPGVKVLKSESSFSSKSAKEESGENQHGCIKGENKKKIFRINQFKENSLGYRTAGDGETKSTFILKYEKIRKYERTGNTDFHKKKIIKCKNRSVIPVHKSDKTTSSQAKNLYEQPEEAFGKSAVQEYKCTTEIPSEHTLVEDKEMVRGLAEEKIVLQNDHAADYRYDGFKKDTNITCEVDFQKDDKSTVFSPGENSSRLEMVDEKTYVFEKKCECRNREALQMHESNCQEYTKQKNEFKMIPCSTIIMNKSCNWIELPPLIIEEVTPSPTIRKEFERAIRIESEQKGCLWNV